MVSPPFLLPDNILHSVLRKSPGHQPAITHSEKNLLSIWASAVTICSSAYLASKFMRKSGVEGSGLRGGPMTCAAA